jgi:TPR repeat protein
LVLVGSVAALSLPRLVHRRAEPRAIATTSAAVPSVTQQPPSAEGVSVRPAYAVEVQRPASESLQQITQEARAGDSFAQFQLAGEYANGKAFPKDLVKAAVWYIMSANSGNQSAKDAAVQITRQLRPFEIAQVRFNVGKMFADGIGTEKNSASAYLWFALAEAAGDVRAKAEEGKLAETMTVAEINDAQTRASTWLSGHRHQTTAALQQPK